jgi:hypothetical protein
LIPQELANAGIYEQTVELILYADSTYGKKVEVPKVVHQNEPAAITEQDLKKNNHA